MTADQEIVAFFNQLKEAGITKEEIREIIDRLEETEDTVRVTTELWMSLLRKGIYNKFPTANNMVVEAMLATVEYIAETKITQVVSGDELDLDVLKTEMTLHGKAVVTVLERMNKV